MHLNKRILEIRDLKIFLLEKYNFIEINEFQGKINFLGEENDENEVVGGKRRRN